MRPRLAKRLPWLFPASRERSVNSRRGVQVVPAVASGKSLDFAPVLAEAEP
jgi:hypothetical protein